jgi:superfamily II DNA or RNA helicase
MTFDIDERLRDYQRDGLDSLREGIKQGHRAQLLYAPTGAGKTEIAIALMEYSRRMGRRSAMIMDRIVLCNQTSTRLDSYGIEHGVLQASHWRYRPAERIQVCSAQTLEKRKSFPGLDLLIVDEAHQIRKATAKFIDAHPSIKVIGLSATPFTKGLGNVFTNVVNTVTTKDLVDTGMLVPLKVFIAREIDMSGAKKIAGEWSDAEATERGIKITGDVVNEWIKKTHEIYGCARKTIVFAASVAHGADLASKFNEAGYNFVPISYMDTDEYKKEVFEDFAKPDTRINGLIAVDILTKGFDVPDVCIGISARPFSKSLSSHIQQMGRVMRMHPSKDFAVWIDHGGNYVRFREDWDSIYAEGAGELDDGREKPKKEPTVKEKEAAKCPRCGSIWGNSDICSHCGFKRERRGNIIEKVGELVELEGKTVSKVDKQTFYSELLYMVKNRGYKEGWAAWKYKEKFGVFPRALEKTERIPSLQTLNWLKSKAIAFAKARK